VINRLRPVFRAVHFKRSLEAARARQALRKVTGPYMTGNTKRQRLSLYASV
jgi:hypothetical protein